jgi:hypothetical protein
MSDNKLLNENTIRRFMKLANVDTMTDSFVNEMYGKSYDRPEDDEKLKEEDAVTEEEVNEEVDALYEEEEEEDDMAMDEPEGDDMEMDMDAEEPAMDAEPEMGAADMSLTEEEAQLLIDLGSRLAEAMGSAGDAGEEESELDMNEPEPEPEPEVDDPEMDMDTEDEEVMQEALVNEVLKRVTKRLVAEKLRK